MPAVRGSAETKGVEFTSLTVGGQGRVYVADCGQVRVLVFSANGRLKDTWRELSPESGVSRNPLGAVKKWKHRAGLGEGFRARPLIQVIRLPLP